MFLRLYERVFAFVKESAEKSLAQVTQRLLQSIEENNELANDTVIEEYNCLRGISKQIHISKQVWDE